MITRFRTLFDKSAHADPTDWAQLFEEFSVPRPFLNDDHPGWSAAEFEPAERSLSNVRRVHAVVLDYDRGETLDEAELLWCDYYGLIHTTRKHTQAEHRFRVILPLTRPVSAFEYTALWHRINERAGGKLDPAPKDASRFWYTPGVGDHPGACFEARMLTGAYLDPDEWLSRAAAEPAAPSGISYISRDVAEKRARAYIAKMPPAVSGEQGHQALWRVARTLVQDFELSPETAERIITTDYNPRCRPPWTQKQIRHKVDDAQRAHTKSPKTDERRSSPAPQPQPGAGAAGQALAVQPEPADDPNSWRRLLRSKSDGSLTKDPGNATLILCNDPEWQGHLEYNSFADRIYWARRPTADLGIDPPQPGDELSDHHWIYVHHWFAKLMGVSFARETIWDAMKTAARQNSVHPLQDYLRGLTWDGKPRIATWLSRYLRAEQTEYSAAVGRFWLISAVARAFHAGCQADHMLILEGPQGGGKSTATRILAGDWHLGRLPDLRDLERAEHALQGKWIVEIGELDAVKGVSATRVKDFITQTRGDYRAPYDRTRSTRPRTCVFVGTTNDDQYLQDPTGARRFWPVTVGTTLRDELSEDRDQIWAEARLCWEAGEQWWPHQELDAQISEQQELRHDVDEFEIVIARWAAERDSFTLGEVLGGCLSLEQGRWEKPLQTRIGACLRRLGFRSKRCMRNGILVREYVNSEKRAS